MRRLALFLFLGSAAFAQITQGPPKGTTVRNGLTPFQGIQVGSTQPPCLPFSAAFATPAFALSTMTTLDHGGEFVGSGLNDLLMGTLANEQPCYTGSGPETIIIKIVGTGTPDTYAWARNSGAFSSPVNVTTTDAAVADGLVVHWNASTGHTLGDKWVIPTRHGIWWVAGLGEDTIQTPTAALAGAGAGSVTNGVHHVAITWATNGGDTYPVGLVSVTVTDNTVDGQILIGNLNQSTDPLYAGTNVWVTKAGGSQYYLADFLPVGYSGSTYTYNKPDSALTVPTSSTWGNITTATPCFYHEDAGRALGSCAIQPFDYGLRFPLGGTNNGAYFFDGFPNGVMGTNGNFLVQMTGSPNTVVCWKSDGKTLGYATVSEITSGTCH